jgi:hypothetical protein
MRNSITIENLDVINNQRINTLVSLGGTSIDLVERNPVLNILTNEDCENFAKYIEKLGLTKDTNMWFFLHYTIIIMMLKK